MRQKRMTRRWPIQQTLYTMENRPTLFTKQTNAARGQGKEEVRNFTREQVRPEGYQKRKVRERVQTKQEKNLN